jgi:type I restriction enzyme R subunit
VLAVQALSRLNRSAPDLGKLSEDLFILDFYNTQDDIKEAFDPFYTSTTLSEATDVNILHELKNTLLSFGVFDMDEVDAFISLYIHGANADQWAPIIDAAADRFNFEIDWPENGKADFKMKCKQFVRIYSRVAAIMPFEMKDWEKLFWFLRYLIPGLHIAGPDIDSLKDLLESVDLNTYGLRRTALNEAITLDSSETTIDPLKPTMVNAGSEEEDKDPLDVILQEFNNRWFNGWEATPDDQKTKLISVAQAVAADEDYQTLVVGNPDQQAVDALMVQIIDRIIRKKRKGDMSLYKEYQQNEGFKVDFRSVITRMLSDLDYLQA